MIETKVKYDFKENIYEIEEYLKVNDLDSNGNFLGRPEQRLSTYGSQDDEHVNYRR